MSVKKIILLIFIFLSVIILSSIFFTVYSFNHKVDIQTEITVRSGASLNSVIKELGNFYPHTFLLKLYFKFNGTENSVKKGTFIFSGKYNVKDVHDMFLSMGKMSYQTFIILPGERRQDLENKLKVFFKDAEIKEYYEDFYKKYEFLKVFKDFEGVFYPDTYFVNKNSKDKLKEFLNMALDLFNKHYYSKFKDRMVDNLNFRDICILASIVEREGRDFNEKKKIAGVFINRLNNNIALESCATVQYMFEKPKKRLLYKHTKISSPYNTYLNKGLPPGPICYFSKKSFEAVLNYEKHDYYYFVLETNGTHHFSKTLEEHNRWKKKK